MLPNQLHWLEIAEYISFGITVVSLGIAIATEGLLYPLIFLTLTLGLNLINRLRWQHLNRKHLAIKLKQLQRQWTEELIPHSLEANTSPSVSEETYRKTLSRVRENLQTLEQSLNSIVQYINKHNLTERIKNLENFAIQLQKDPDFLKLSPDEVTFFPNEANVRALSPKLPLSSLPLDSIEALPAIPHWRCIHHLQEHSEGVEALAISRDQQFLVSIGWDRSLKLWELASGHLMSTIDAHDQGILALVLLKFAQNQANYWVATGSFDQTIKLWSLTSTVEGQHTLELKQILKGHTGSIQALAYAPQASLLMSGSYDQTVKQWQLEIGQVVASSYDALGAIYALAIDPQERYIASGGPDGTITLWQLNSGVKLALLGGNISSIESLVISPDGQFIGAGCVDGTIKLWQLEQEIIAERLIQPIRILNAHQGQVKSLLFNPDGQLLLSGGTDGQIKVWHPHHPEARSVLTLADELNSPPISVSCLVLSDNGQYLAAGGGDGTIKVWQIIA